MFYSDDPALDFERYDREREKRLEKLPICADCGEFIQDEYAFCRHGEWLCEACADACKRLVDVE